MNNTCCLIDSSGKIFEFSQTYAEHYKFIVKCEQIPLSNHGFNLYVKIILEADIGYYISSIAPKKCILIINGIQYNSQVNIGLHSGETRVLYEYTIGIIYYDSNDQKNIKVSCSIESDIILAGNFIPAMLVCGKTIFVNPNHDVKNQNTIDYASQLFTCVVASKYEFDIQESKYRIAKVCTKIVQIGLSDDDVTSVKKSGILKNYSFHDYINGSTINKVYIKHLLYDHNNKWDIYEFVIRDAQDWIELMKNKCEKYIFNE